MCHQALVSSRLITNVVRAKVKVTAADILLELSHLSELCLRHLLLALVRISHRCLVQTDKPVRDISLMLDSEVSLIISTFQIFHVIGLDRSRLFFNLPRLQNVRFINWLLLADAAIRSDDNVRLANLLAIFLSRGVGRLLGVHFVLNESSFGGRLIGRDI